MVSNMGMRAMCVWGEAISQISVHGTVKRDVEAYSMRDRTARNEIMQPGP